MTRFPSHQPQFWLAALLVFVQLCLANLALAQVCAIPGRDNPATISGVVNTYYPAAAGNAASGQTTINLSTVRNAAQPAIEIGDLILIIQMQDGSATDFSTVAASYGSNTATAGQYEYATVASKTPATGGTHPTIITITTNLGNTYTQNMANRQTFQVIRVPQYASATVSATLTALPWTTTSNVAGGLGSGGILAIDVAGELTLQAGARLDVTGQGFRGGLGLNHSNTRTSGTFSDQRYNTTELNGASKGEGTAGTPRHVFDGTSTGQTYTSDGYSNGSYGQGAPGNAGGGGNDGDPTGVNGGGNQRNSGGGGGGNRGAGGIGGNAWDGDSAALANRDAGGRGGKANATSTGGKLFLGGGGGAGTQNNSSAGSVTTYPPNASGGGASGIISNSGAIGGGIVMVRTGKLTSATGAQILANGQRAYNGNGGSDSAGGAGAGGSVVVRTPIPNVTGLTIQAQGGRGGDSTYRKHGPGGGGGGGVILTDFSPTGVTTSVTAGANGFAPANSGGGSGGPAIDDPYGATAGAVGLVTTGTPITEPGTGPGYSCMPTLSVIKANEPSNALVSYSQGIANTNQYKITISNTGGGSAQSVQVTDILPTGFTLAGGPAPAAVLAGGASGTLVTAGSSTLVFSGFTIPNGGSVTITYTVNIANSVPLGTYSNPAQVEFLDPTRSTGGRLVKPSTNTDGSGNTSYQTTGATVGGSNYNTALTNEDVRLVAAQISGFVYGDSNHDAIKNGAETGSATDFTGLFVKLMPTAGGNAIAAVAVDPATGAYNFTNVAIGSYNLILDDNNTLTDTTSSKPANYLGTEAPSQIRAVTVVNNSDNLTNQNFGLYKGSRVTGRVWRDDGNGSTLANNGLQLGTEPGLGNFTVSLLSGVSVIDTSTTVGNGDYVLYVPFGTANPLIQVTKPSGWTATGINIFDANVCLAANSSSASQRFVGDTTCIGTASFVSGLVYNDYNFGLVPPIALAANSAQSAGTPSSVSYPHNFTPGTLGNVSFSVTGTQPGFGYALYLDTNNNSVVDGADQSLSSPLTVDNTWPRNPDGTLATRRIVLVVNIPSGVATGTVDMATIVASQSFANNLPVLRSASVLDTTTITGSNGNNGILRLIKSSRNCGNITDLAVCSGAYSLNIIQAKPGEVVEYKIEYSNIGSGSISSVVVFDNPPYFSDVITGFKFWTRPNGSAGNVGNISLSISTGLKLELNKPGFDLINPLLPGENGYVLYRVRVR
jgi:hypothetical protein